MNLNQITPTLTVVRALLLTIMLGGMFVRPAAAQSGGRPAAVADIPELADAALKGFSVRVRVASRLDTGRVIVVLDSAFVDASKRAEAERALQRAAVSRSEATAPVEYVVALKSFESLPNSVAKVMATLAPRASRSKCDTKLFAILLVNRFGKWETQLIVPVAVPGCKV